MFQQILPCSAPARVRQTDVYPGTILFRWKKMSEFVSDKTLTGDLIKSTNLDVAVVTESRKSWTAAARAVRSARGPAARMRTRGRCYLSLRFASFPTKGVLSARLFATLRPRRRTIVSRFGLRRDRSLSPRALSGRSRTVLVDSVARGRKKREGEARERENARAV